LQQPGRGGEGVQDLLCLLLASCVGGGEVGADGGAGLVQVCGARLIQHRRVGVRGGGPVALVVGGVRFQDGPQLLRVRVAQAIWSSSRSAIWCRTGTAAASAARACQCSTSSVRVRSGRSSRVKRAAVPTRVFVISSWNASPSASASCTARVRTDGGG
jgi:hypothetical protein